jgi:hypothetical protein
VVRETVTHYPAVLPLGPDVTQSILLIWLLSKWWPWQLPIGRAVKIVIVEATQSE